MRLPQGPILRGALFSFIGFTIWACSDALTKGCGLSGLSPFVIIGLPSWFAALTVFLGLAATKRLHRLRPTLWKPHAIRSGIFLVVSFANVLSFINLPLTTVYVGIFASPFLISLFGALFMGETLSRRQIGAIVVGFCGVLLALLPEAHSGSTGPGNATLGFTVLPFFMLLFVANMLYLRILGRTETPESTTFIPFVVRALVFLPIFWFEPIGDFTLRTWALMVAMGIFAGVGFLFVSTAFKLAPVAIVSSFHYTQLISGAILGYLLWGTIPSLWIAMGGLLIVASGLLVAHEARRQGASPASTPQPALQEG